MTQGNARHRSFGDRIRLAASDRGVDANRLRRALVFQRLLARLGPAGLVLKGGYCLEVRLATSARATKDIDLVGRIALTRDQATLRDDFDELLEQGEIEDGFSFRVGKAVLLRGEDAPAQAWRVDVLAFLEGAEFERVKVDLIGQLDEVRGATERMVIPAPVAIPGLEPVTVEAVDVYQHAAEKFHAYSRIYAHDRPSSRVKDLVDLVLLIEAGLLTDGSRLGERIRIVSQERDGSPPGSPLPLPPGDWTQPYAAFAADLDLTAGATDAAYDLVAAVHAAALTERTTS
ncbi:hypothetical protein N802_08930 [Knoellia sinensis KCTC 19936]|uniref:Nucleotidyl transferase AbiEii/AbiGii toxin family protein n=1 Tax=Knoellia sinensis KCTC 19936 TaxID=1385520 RepID=A0A0A0JAS2_9MICO|nr:nucleotidyl transferase AbiEii/AbiGii toxin family protein [Knoellia sinensis]KGN33899.1 hypothetical protein N802_08930 [Knoellia sinensis KCTC 19936]